jgi:hypothetical protein
MVEIIPYTTENKHFIKTLNVEWLQKYFYVEIPIGSSNDERSNIKMELSLL